MLCPKNLPISYNLIGWTKKRLAGYKCPKKIFFINDKDMPRNATGKILHRDLKLKVDDILEGKL